METNVPQPGQTVSPTGSGPPAGQASPGAGQPAQDPASAAQPAPAAAPGAPAAPSAPPAAATSQSQPAATPEPPQPPQAATDDEPQVELGSESADDMAGEAAEADDIEADAAAGPAIAWTASEFIAHDKSVSWYAGLAAAAAAFAGLVFLITKDFVSVSVVLVAAFILGIYAGHRPKQLEYGIDASGLTVGPKRFSYNEFRSFAVMPEGAFSSIVFMPLKRFAVPTTIYYPPEEEDHIVGMLADHLPMEQRGHDAVDRLMHRIRF